MITNRISRVGLTVAAVGSLALLAACRSAPREAVFGPSAPPVSIGYGEVGRGEVTTAISSFAVDPEEVGRFATIEEMLEARVPGVEVIRTGSGARLRIRGTRSLIGDAEPLYVVDGQPLMNIPGGGLLGVVPHDVERIDILKDAAATAIYGVRGGNGVILITTRKAL